ncbi:hypothetical protein L1887_17997 [Cichorium endivia]|nr:hypothetical protein L1887_17997 [Cichorium endivia]
MYEQSLHQDDCNKSLDLNYEPSNSQGLDVDQTFEVDQIDKETFMISLGDSQKMKNKGKKQKESGTPINITMSMKLKDVVRANNNKKRSKKVVGNQGYVLVFI